MTTAPEIVARERELNSLYIVTVAVILVIVTATFGSLIFAFFWRSYNGYLWGHLQVPPLLWGTTAVLAASSFCLERARVANEGARPVRFYQMVKWTTVLGVIFLVGQATAWLQVTHSNLFLTERQTFVVYLYVQRHARHSYFGRLRRISYLLYRAREAVSGPRYQMTTRAYTNALAIFWHYLGFVWLVLFLLLLTWKR